MTADFNFYVNRQGIRGRKGEQGEQGFSPIITVKTNTANDYVLNVQNEDGNFDTPNLRGNAIENTGGTYIRFNPDDGSMYTGDADAASNSQAGVVLLSNYEQLEAGGSEDLIPTSSDVYDFVTSKVSDLGFNALAQTLAAGTNITLDVDDENKEITINASDGFDPSVPNTFSGGQTFNTPSGSTSNTIYPAITIPMGNPNASIVIGRNAQDQTVIAATGQRLRIGTTDSSRPAVDFYQESTTYFPSIVTASVASDNINYGDDTQDMHYPLFNALNFHAGTGINISHTGTGDAKQYTISASPDLTNYVTLNTNQTITGTKTFQYGLSSYSSVKAKDIRIWDGGQREQGRLGGNDTGTTKLTLSSKGILEFKSWSDGASSGYTSRTVDLANILTTSEITTTINSQSTNDKVPSALAVYNALSNVSTVSKIKATNSLLTESGGYATMTISNTLGTDEVNVSVYQIGVSSNTQVYPTVEVNSSTISVTFPTSADIPADTYKVVITG